MNKNKVILISIDAMRPDGFLKCKNPYIEEMMKKAYYTLDGKTVLPSVTLPCHMSLFHSVPPQRHGITTNTYVPMVRPLNGLFEQLHKAGKICAMYYGWGQLRDIATPITVTYAQCINARRTVGSSDTELTDCALARIRKNKPDFVFLYMVEADEKGGHDHGWMTEPYLNLLSIALDNVKRVIEECGDEYTIIVTADHGGHDRTHGTDMPEDMTIPMFYFGEQFETGKRFSGGSILDIAPTIAKIMDVPPADEWEGTSVI